MVREPVLVTATYSGILQIWNTKETRWKTKKFYKPVGNYLVNELSIDSQQQKLIAGCTDAVKLFDISEGNFNPYMEDIKNESNVTSLGNENNFIRI